MRGVISTNMDASEILEEIEICLSSIPKGDSKWFASIEGQLRYCKKVILGKDKPNHVAELKMGLMAFRELDGFDEGSKEFSFADSVSKIQSYLQQNYLKYSEKVKLGIHRHS